MNEASKKCPYAPECKYVENDTCNLQCEAERDAMFDYAEEQWMTERGEL